MDRLIKLIKIFNQKKFIALAIIVVVVAGFFLLRSKSSAPKIEYASISKQTIKQTISASGTLTGSQSAVLKFQASGKLNYLKIKVGDRVKEGQVIAGLDTRSLNLSLNQAQNTLADKQATLRKTLDDIHLFQYGNGGFSNVATANETETQRAARITAEEAANSAEDSVKAVQVALQNSAITSPISGVITKADIVPGQNVTTLDTIAEVVDDSGIYFEAEVDEGDVAQIKTGQKAEITLNAYGEKTFPGTVEKIIPATKTTSSGATVVIVKIILDNPGISLIDSLNGQSAIIITQKENVLAIPNECLVDDTHVYIEKDGKNVLTEIKTGISSDTYTEIVSGLSENQQVVKNPSAVKK